jgi:AAA domain-containing protein
VAEGGAIMTTLKQDNAEAKRRAMGDGNSVQYHLDQIRGTKYKSRNNGRGDDLKSNGSSDGSHRVQFKDTAGQREGERFDDSELIANGWTATVYSYKLPDGTPLYQQNRYDPTERAGVDAPKKKYIPTRPDGKHHIIGPGERRILYNWPAIIRAGPGATVFVTEGEKNADDLTKRGLLATTVVSHWWSDECIAALTGYDLIILADHDKDGERDANKAHGMLSKVSKTIRLVPFQHLWKHLTPEQKRPLPWNPLQTPDPNREPPANFDVSDWLDHGGNADKLLEICRELPADGIIIASPHEFPDEKTLPKWDFLYDKHLLRGTVSATVATGSTGKSSKSIVEALEMATGKPLLGVSVQRQVMVNPKEPDPEMTPELLAKLKSEPGGGLSCDALDNPRQIVPLRVLLINLEDNREAVDKRIAAVMRHYKLTPEDVGGRLFTIAKGELSFKIAAQSRSGVVVRNEPAIKGMIALLLEKKIDVFSIDPFIATHSVNENDNTAIRNVIECYDTIAEAANCAVSIWHHTRKSNGQEATIDSARGAGAFADACRSVRVLETMTAAEAKKTELPEHSRYFRSFSGKLNFAPATDKSDWFQIISVPLDNGGGPFGDRLFGDDVGVVTTWVPPANEKQELSMSEMSDICRAVAGAEWREDVRASMWVGKAIATAMNLDVDTNKEKIKGILKTLLKSGMLKTRPGITKTRNSVIFVEVGGFAAM